MGDRGYGYVRISEDDLLLERGVTRQAEDVRELAAARSVNMVHLGSDNHISALKGKPRPAYQELMAAVETGQVDVVLVYMTSRLWRNRRERAQAFDTFAKHRIRVFAVKGPELDFSTASGRMLAGVLGEFDTFESEVKAERIAREALQRAQEGRPNGTIPYGWSRTWVRDDRGRVISSQDHEDQAQADVVRRIVRDLLAGETMRGVTAALNAEGIPAPGGGAWGKTSVRKIAMRPANVGLRTHHGEVIGKATWPALVDHGDHDRVVALLNDPGRRTQRTGARKHLLSGGIGQCGVCGGVLRVQPKGGNPLYVCEARGCVGRRQERVDELVHGYAIALLGSDDWREALHPDQDLEPLEAEVLALRARLNTAADTYATGGISLEQLTRVTAGVRPQLDEAERLLREATGPAKQVLDGLTGEAAEQTWHGTSVARQRAVLKALRVTVAIMPTRQGKGFVPDDVVLTIGA